ncbi:MAG: hypothetical protein EOO39_34045 [Cytophagaceae bacterium]|nr:MAG: hypothetical protein EOO39_34045 [Cytophagaceae bacterium]
MKRLLALLFFLPTLQGCASLMTELPPQPTVPYVDVMKFMGPWYVIGCIPTMFEKGAHNAVETYTWNAEKDRIDRNYHYQRKRVNDGW